MKAVIIRTNEMKVIRTITLLFLLFTNVVFGQKTAGFVADQKGNSLAFANIFIIDDGQQVFATSDIDGHFSFSDNITKNKKLYALYSKCSSDTILVTENSATNLKLIINIKLDCASKIEITNCRNNFFMKGAYYVDLKDFSNNELKIVNNEEIITKKEYSPYDYERIDGDKKYKADNGQIYTGQELIALKKLPLELWDKANFKPIDEEKKVKLTPNEY